MRVTLTCPKHFPITLILRRGEDVLSALTEFPHTKAVTHLGEEFYRFTGSAWARGSAEELVEKAFKARGLVMPSGYPIKRWAADAFTAEEVVLRVLKTEKDRREYKPLYGESR